MLVLQNWPQHARERIADSPREGPPLPDLSPDLDGFLEIRFEGVREHAGTVGIEKEDVALRIEMERPEVEIARTGDAEIVVDDHGLGVERRRLIFEDPHAAIEEARVVSMPRVPNQRDVAFARQEKAHVDSARGRLAENV